MRRLAFVPLLFAVACSGGDDDETPKPDRDGGVEEIRDAGENTARDGSVRDGGDGTRDGGDETRDGGDGVGPQGCLNVSGDADLSFDIVPSEQASITLTMNGMDPPAATRQRGLFRFTNEVWQGGAGGPVMSMSGPVVSDIDLIPGPHAVQFVSGSCEPPDDTPYCQNIRRSMMLTAGAQTIDYEYGPLDISLSVDGGGPLPEQMTPRGRLSFSSQDPTISFTRSFEIPGTGVAQLRTGAYSADYDAFISLFTFPCNDTVVCGAGPIGSVTVHPLSSAVTIDLTTAIVQGTVTQDGGPFGMNAIGPGQLIFVPSEGGGSANIDLENDGTYRLRLLTGTYDVRFAGFEDGSGNTPVNEAIVLAEDLVINANGTFDFDLTTVDVDISLTSNGGPIPMGTEEGELILRTADGNYSAGIPVAALIAGSWARKIVAGRYDIEWFTAGCDTDVPCTSYPVMTDVDFTTDRMLVVDLVSHPVTIALTANGAPIADSTGSRGTVSISRVDETGAEGRDVAATGPAGVSTRLAPGTYAVFWTPPFDDRCRDGDLGPVPCNLTSLGEIEVTGPTDVTLDIASVLVRGVVNIGGTPLAPPMGIEPFLTLGSELTGGYPSNVAADGTFEVRVPPGDYSVTYGPNGWCDGRTVDAPRPCASQRIHVCP